MPTLVTLNKAIPMPETIYHPDGTHSHPDGTTHSHKHGHSHKIPQEEQDAIDQFFITTLSDSVQVNVYGFIKAYNTIPNILDLYEHNQRFRERCIRIGMVLRAGRRASHEYRHAYAIQYSPTPGSYLTIWTNYDFDLFDQPLHLWADYDLFDFERIS